MSEIASATQAAQSLIATFGNISPVSHSVWVKTEVDKKGEFIHKICVSKHPKFKGKLDIPDTHAGFIVEQVPWPKGMN